MAKMLYFPLEGPRMSFGETSRWYDRDTAGYPTMSAIVGILGSALGYDINKKDDCDKLVALSNSIQLAVRRNRAGVIHEDFQTVRGPFISAEGKLLEDTGKIRRKNYLEDASFTVIITSEVDGLLEMLAEALRYPKHVLYLGRKNCLPARKMWPNITEEYASVEEAFRHIDIPTYITEENNRLEIEYQDLNGMFLRNDKICGCRKYCSRFVTRKTIEVDPYQGDDAQDDFDNLGDYYFDITSIDDEELLAEPLGVDEHELAKQHWRQPIDLDAADATVYISKFVLNCAYPNLPQILKDSGEMHKEIQKIFFAKRSDDNVLWYLRQTREMIEIYVRSSQKPRYNTGLLTCMGIKADIDKFEAGNTFRFNLLCNPSMQNNGKRYGLTDRVQIIEWFRQKGTRCGFTVQDAVCEQTDKADVTRKGKKFNFVAASLSGQIIVTDPDLFGRYYANGIGRELSYGCGLMRLLPR